MVGDVVYALHPEFDGAHGKQLPSVSFGMAGQHSAFVIAGAGIKQTGLLTKQVRSIDVAPTICYLTGVPMPMQVEGGVVYEALETPIGIWNSPTICRGAGDWGLEVGRLELARWSIGKWQKHRHIEQLRFKAVAP